MFSSVLIPPLNYKINFFNRLLSFEADYMPTCLSVLYNCSQYGAEMQLQLAKYRYCQKIEDAT